MSSPSLSLSQAQRSQLLELLERLVNVQSGTRNIEGIRQVQEIGRQELEVLGFQTRLVEAPGYGPHLVAERLRADRPRIVLDGHVDTVFPASTIPTFRIDGDKCFGQGVIDMKGGNVCLLGALQLLHQSGMLDSLSLRVVFVSDEEIGSPSSRSIITEFAPQTDLVMVFEEAGEKGEVVVGRSGIQVVEVRTSGVAGHSGNVKGIRRNAIEELAYKICALREAAYDLTEEGILFSVGTIKGGIAHNVIADAASCLINLRYTSDKVFQRLVEVFDAIVQSPNIPGTSTSLHWDHAGSPAMGVTDKALSAALVCTLVAKELGYEVGIETRGGTSNANLWSHAGATVLDGLGPIGGDDHSDREWMLIPTLFQRVELVARVLTRIGCGFALDTAANTGQVESLPLFGSN